MKLVVSHIAIAGVVAGSIAEFFLSHVIVVKQCDELAMTYVGVVMVLVECVVVYVVVAVVVGIFSMVLVVAAKIVVGSQFVSLTSVGIVTIIFVSLVALQRELVAIGIGVSMLRACQVGF